MERTYLYKTLFLFSSVAFAQTQTDTSSPGAFPTMAAQDGFGVAEGGVGSISQEGNEAGNEGADGGAWSLSTGGIVGISVGIAIVVLAIGGMWALWYMAKKRQWTIKETMKRASRRLTGRKNHPRTPRAVPSSSGPNRRATMRAKPSALKNQYKDIDLERNVAAKHQKPSPGWLEAEKERSRSRSPEDDTKDNASKAGGLMTKLGFGKR